jgi:hypothetical protein
LLLTIKLHPRIADFNLKIALLTVVDKEVGIYAIQNLGREGREEMQESINAVCIRNDQFTSVYMLAIIL